MIKHITAQYFQPNSVHFTTSANINWGVRATIKRCMVSHLVLLGGLMTVANLCFAQATSCVSPAASAVSPPAIILAISGIPPTIPHAASAVTPTTPAITNESVRLILGGDIVLGNSFLVNDIPKDWEQQYFAGVRSILKQADMVVGNLEGALTEHSTSTKSTGSGRQFAFRSPPHYAALLKEEGFSVLNVANNHAYDFGEIGLRDTLAALEKAEITAVGLPDEIKIINVRGLNIAVIGFSNSSRFNSVMDLTRGAQLVQQAKAREAYVIVTFHAGAEGAPAIWHADEEEMFMGENRGNTVAFSRAMITAGADLIVGHGPHVLRAAECFQGKPIIYSLGNFVGVGGLSAQKFAAVSALLDVSLGLDGTIHRLELVPLRFNEQKLPAIDPHALGTRLVNYLGKHARYAGEFIEFPLSESGQEEFDVWFKANKHYAEPAGL